MSERRAYHLREARALARHALAHGAVLVSPTLVRWSLSGTCSNPQDVLLEGKHDAKEDLGGERPLSVVMHVRCRRCPACLGARRRVWSERAQAETRLAARTWFGTLTLSENEQVRALYRAQLACRRRGTEWDRLAKPRSGEAPSEYAARNARVQFSRIHDAISPEIVKYFKRIRKESDSKLRYLLVVEAHKSGRPHYHVLIHESAPDRPIRKRTLQGQWKLGFTNFRLVSDLAEARYVCKYLTKAAEARVRASRHYGRHTTEREMRRGGDERPEARAGSPLSPSGLGKRRSEP